MLAARPLALLATLATAACHSGPPPCIDPAASAAIGQGYTLVRRQSGALWSRGTNGRGELATGDESPQATPGLRRGLSAAAVAAGDHYSLALLASGDVYHWGDGVGPSPLPLGPGNVRQLATGSGYSLAVTRDGSVVEWGRARISQTVLSR